MLRHLLKQATGISRVKLLWAVVAMLVPGQLFALWLLCNRQMLRAEVRDATWQVQRNAIADCMRYIPKATLNSCVARIYLADRVATRT